MADFNTWRGIGVGGYRAAKGAVVGTAQFASNVYHDPQGTFNKTISQIEDLGELAGNYYFDESFRDQANASAYASVVNSASLPNYERGLIAGGLAVQAGMAVMPGLGAGRFALRLGGQALKVGVKAGAKVTPKMVGSAQGAVSGALKQASNALRAHHSFDESRNLHSCGLCF